MKYYLVATALVFNLSAIAQNVTMNGHLTVKVYTVTNSFNDDGTVTSKSEAEDKYSVDQLLTYYPGINNPTKARLEFCSDNNATCNFITGTNAFIPAPKEVSSSGFVKSPVDYVTTYTSWTLCDGQMKETYKAEGNGKISDYMVMTAIGFVKPKPVATDDIEPVPLVKSKKNLDDFPPIPLVKGDNSYRLYVNIGGITPNINPNAPKNREQSRDCTIDQWTMNDPSKYGLSVPEIAELSHHVQSSTTPEQVVFSRYTPVSDAQVQQLIKTGKGNLELRYFSYTKNLDGNNKVTSETERRIWVTFSIQ